MLYTPHRRGHFKSVSPFADPNAMILQVDTNKTGAGGTASNTFKLPISGAPYGTHNFTVYWDSTDLTQVTTGVTASTDARLTHVYPSVGVRLVAIVGTCHAIQFGNGAADARKLVQVYQWGRVMSETGNTNTSSMFGQAVNLTTLAVDTYDLTLCLTNANAMFGDLPTLPNWPGSMDLPRLTTASMMLNSATGIPSNDEWYSKFLVSQAACNSHDGVAMDAPYLGSGWFAGSAGFLAREHLINVHSWALVDALYSE